MCGVKQSVKHVYGTSQNASQCRQMVQNLNQQRGELSEESKQEVGSEETEDEISKIAMNGTQSRWSIYLVNPDPDEPNK